MLDIAQNQHLQHNATLYYIMQHNWRLMRKNESERTNKKDM